ncbi:MAG: hypothetical protein U9Q99_02830 [Nanoarchaeota archaeon]|nr:hypothetical protein [Nanoarchaeota archaeon]
MIKFIKGLKKYLKIAVKEYKSLFEGIEKKVLFHLNSKKLEIQTELKSSNKFNLYFTAKDEYILDGDKIGLKKIFEKYEKIYETLHNSNSHLVKETSSVEILKTAFLNFRNSLEKSFQ